MKKLFLIMAAIAIMPASVLAENSMTDASATDSSKVHYIRRPQISDSRVMEQNRRRNVVFVNEDVTTHVIMPENIKLVDISTDKIVGNQCADNIVRIKPTGRMKENEVAGTVTVIGERHLAQFNVVYVPGPARAAATCRILPEQLERYTNPDVLMPQRDMARYSWAIASSRPKFNNIRTMAYGIKAVVNNIYSIGDYFFIDYSLFNNTKIKYDIAETRVKLTDKKETKATNSQTIDLTPVFSLNNARSFKKAYRNVLVLEKLTFPDSKQLRLEISENQISGRVVYLFIDYEDILHADGYDESFDRLLP
jgi:conjugative transposon TraN protein